LGIGQKLVEAVAGAHAGAKIYAITDVRNLASIQLKRNIGFVPTGTPISDRKGNATLQVYVLSGTGDDR
jgi:hypothetical protein